MVLALPQQMNVLPVLLATLAVVLAVPHDEAIVRLHAERASLSMREALRAPPMHAELPEASLLRCPLCRQASSMTRRNPSLVSTIRRSMAAHGCQR